MDLILVTFGDMELIFKPELSHFESPLTRGRIYFPLNSESVQPHFSNSIENATPLLIVNPVTKMQLHPAAHSLSVYS